MRKLIASINMTLDGFCNHTAAIPDDELHEFFNELLRSVDTLVFGRITYQLMEDAWPPLVKNPSGNKPEDDFAILIDNANKVVFSHTLKTVTWRNTRLADKNLKDEVTALKEQAGKDILVGSPSLIAELTQLRLIDEYRLCMHPVILGKGLTLFKNISERVDLKLLKTKPFGSGAIVLYYAPVVTVQKT